MFPTLFHSLVHLQSPLVTFPIHNSLINLPKSLRLMQPCLSKTYFDTCPPQPPSANVTPEELRVPSALTQPVTPEEAVAESPALQCDSTMESDSMSSSPDSTCSAASTASYTLWPRLPIPYNETALSCLHGRPYIRTLNFLSIPSQLSVMMMKWDQRQMHLQKSRQILHPHKMNC